MLRLEALTLARGAHIRVGDLLVFLQQCALLSSLCMACSKLCPQCVIIPSRCIAARLCTVGCGSQRLTACQCPRRMGGCLLQHTLREAMLCMQAAMFLGYAHMAKCSWPCLQEIGLYLTSCSCCSRQSCFPSSAAGALFYAPIGIKHALEALWRKMVCPALKQVHDARYMAKVKRKFAACSALAIGVGRDRSGCTAIPQLQQLHVLGLVDITVQQQPIGVFVWAKDARQRREWHLNSRIIT